MFEGVDELPSSQDLKCQILERRKLMEMSLPFCITFSLEAFAVSEEEQMQVENYSTSMD